MRARNHFVNPVRTWATAGALLIATAAAAQAPARYDAGTISGLPARNVGSAAMSGRIAALTAVDDGGRLTVYLGSASGGGWKSINGGTTFKPLVDKEATQSVGPGAVDPSNPRNGWARTREA